MSLMSTHPHSEKAGDMRANYLHEKHLQDHKLDSLQKRIVSLSEELLSTAQRVGYSNRPSLLVQNRAFLMNPCSYFH